MTCIAGLVHKGKVYMGGDSAGVSGYHLTIQARPKVFKKGEWVFGYTTSFRMGQLIEHAFVPPDCRDIDDAGMHRYLCTDFVDGLRKCLKDGGFAEIDKSVERGGTFLVGRRGRLWSIHGDFQVAESSSGMDSCGCGHAYAMGAMHVTAGKPPHDRIRLALEAAEAYNAGVRGPFTIVST